MTDYSKLVEALRCCIQNPPETCVGCTYNIGNNECNVKRMIVDAADAIEELRKVNCELRELYEDAVRKLPNRGEWISVNPMVDSVQCSVCGGQLFSAELETPYCPYCGAKMEVQE